MRGGVNLRGIFSLFGRSRANEQDFIAQRLNETAFVGSPHLLANQGPNGLNLVDPRVWTTERTFLGVLVNKGPNGEADYTDDRYWVITAQIGQDANSGPDDEAFTYPDDSYGEGLWITAHNTPEIPSGTHSLTTIAPPTDYGQSLPTNTVIVRVHEQHCIKTEVGTVPNVKYVFEVSAAAGTITGKVTDNASGKGKYVGKSFSDPTADVLATGDLAEADFGTLSSTVDCLILNPPELGSSNTGHDVTAPTNTSQFSLYFTGRLVRINGDGTKVIHAQMFWAGC